MVTEEVVVKKPTKEPEVENVEEEHVSTSRPIPITIVRPLTKPAPELEMIGSSLRIQLNDTILEVPVLKPQTRLNGPVIDITLPPQPEISLSTPKPDRGKGKVTDDTESPPKLIKDLSVVHLDPDEPKGDKEAKLLEMTKPKLIKFVQVEATKAGVDPKILASAKGGQDFKKIQDAEIKVHNRECFKKIKRSRELKKKRIKKYRWTTSSRLKPKTITDIKIHPNTKHVALIVFRGTDKRNFDVHNAFNFVLSIPSRRKRKHQELKPEIHNPGLKCNISQPEGVPFVNNMVIEDLSMECSLLMSLAMRPFKELMTFIK
nr:hypothetical protein [Tanacetum cinerariifolium]